MSFLVISAPAITEDKPLVVNKNIHSSFLPRVKFQFHTLAPFSAILPVRLPNQPAYMQLPQRFPIQGELCSHRRLSLCSHLLQWFLFNQNHLPKINKTNKQMGRGWECKHCL